MITNNFAKFESSCPKDISNQLGYQLLGNHLNGIYHLPIIISDLGCHGNQTKQA